MGPKLYGRLEAECEKYCAEKIEGLLNQSPDCDVYLNLVHTTWLDHCEQILTIRSIFLYLDRTYVKQTSGIRSLWDMGLQLFRQHLTKHEEVERKTVHGILTLIERERTGEAIDRGLLKNLLRMFTSLGSYVDGFETQFLAETKTFYAAEAKQFLESSEVPQYLLRCEQRLQEENNRCLHYLDQSTRKQLIATVETQLLETRVSAIMEKGLDSLLEAHKKEDLHRLYSLFARVGALPSLKNSWSSYVKRRGLEVVQDEEKEKEMVATLLEFKSKLDSILDDCFQKNEIFSYALKESFEYFINYRQNRPAELVAKFIDAQLRSGNKGASDEQLEATLDKVLILFRYIHGKDVFEAFYKKDLAKRLLLNRSASIDAEKSMIAKLKTECGSQFTQKLEGMFKDVELSKDIMTSFRESSQARTSVFNSIDMNVQILTTGYWPTYPPVDVELPDEMHVCQTIFRDFYLAKYNGRRLMWQNSLGTCVLKAEFPRGRKELSLSLFQAVVLMLFNDVDEMSFQDIKRFSKIEDRELRRTLQSLACGKVRVLQKKPKGREVDDDDSFVFNKEFDEKLYRIKVNAIQMKETPEENSATTERVFQDRQHQVDAAIVRIMKTRKQLAHQLLIGELLKQLKFPVRSADLKKRIESLIEREYLER
eukprot:scaffold3731_cov381-Prasinococcus_capsulatus_cf.AAC.3